MVPKRAILARVVERSFPILGTPDLRRALDFYVGLLGGVVSYQFPEKDTPRYGNAWRAWLIRTATT